jgi:hypothetical protein
MQGRGTIDPEADVEAIALAVIGSCLRRSWQRYLFGPRGPKLPDLARSVQAVADLLRLRGD